jgi:hypothetical protein
VHEAARAGSQDDRVSDFFNGRRELSKNQARGLAAYLDIPIGMLLV